MIVFSDALIPLDLIATMSNWPTRSDVLILRTIAAQRWSAVNDSVGFATLVLVGDGFGLVDVEVSADPEGVTSIGGAALGTAPHPPSAAVIIKAQLICHARRSPLARRTAPRSP
jgi:hypothetical protein